MFFSNKIQPTFHYFGYKLAKSLHNVIMKYSLASSKLNPLSPSSPSYAVQVREYLDKQIDIQFEPLFRDTISTYSKTDQYSYLYIVTHDPLVSDNIALIKHLFVLYEDHVDIYTQDVENMSSIISSCSDLPTDIEGIYISIITDFVTAYSPSLYSEEKYMATLESELIKQTHPNFSAKVSSMRRRISVIKRLCDSISRAIGSYSLSVSPKNSDLVSDTVTITDSLVENALYLRDFSTTVRESYQQQVDIGLNATMKFLATVNTVFLPLMLLAGWYGMNIPMPEVEFRYSYPIIILFAVILTIVLVVTFRRKKWF